VTIESRIRPVLGRIRLDRIRPGDLDVCYARWRMTMTSEMAAEAFTRLT
jgi:hypothetical protein